MLEEIDGILGKYRIRTKNIFGMRRNLNPILRNVAEKWKYFSLGDRVRILDGVCVAIPYGDLGDIESNLPAIMQKWNEFTRAHDETEVL